MYVHTHNGVERIDWPNGGSYLNQLAVIPEIWEIITDELVNFKEEMRSRK